MQLLLHTCLLLHQDSHNMQLKTFASPFRKSAAVNYPTMYAFTDCNCCIIEDGCFVQLAYGMTSVRPPLGYI